MVSDVILNARKAWEQATAFQIVPDFATGNEAVEHCRKLSKESPSVMSGVSGMLSDQDPLVVAYALYALFLARSKLLTELPEALFGDGRSVPTTQGSFLLSKPLGQIAQRFVSEANTWK